MVQWVMILVDKPGDLSFIFGRCKVKLTPICCAQLSIGKLWDVDINYEMWTHTHMAHMGWTDGLEHWLQEHWLFCQSI